MAAVGCVLVLEPQPEIRDLVGLVAGRLGHEVLIEIPTPARSLDVVAPFTLSELKRELARAVPVSSSDAA